MEATPDAPPVPTPVPDAGAGDTPGLRKRMIAQRADPAFLRAEPVAKLLAAERPPRASVLKASGTAPD